MNKEKITFEERMKRANAQPCEERVPAHRACGRTICGKEAIAITVSGKLLCLEHTEAHEAKWMTRITRLRGKETESKWARERGITA